MYQTQLKVKAGKFDATNVLKKIYEELNPKIYTCKANLFN